MKKTFPIRTQSFAWNYKSFDDSSQPLDPQQKRRSFVHFKTGHFLRLLTFYWRSLSIFLIVNFFYIVRCLSKNKKHITKGFSLCSAASSPSFTSFFCFFTAFSSLQCFCQSSECRSWDESLHCCRTSWLIAVRRGNGARSPATPPRPIVARWFSCSPA